jgi:hypothetical protein
LTRRLNGNISLHPNAPLFLEAQEIITQPDEKHFCPFRIFPWVGVTGYGIAIKLIFWYKEGIFRG